MSDLPPAWATELHRQGFCPDCTPKIVAWLHEGLKALEDGSWGTALAEEGVHVKLTPDSPEVTR